MLNVLMVICLSGTTVATILEHGSCPDVKTKENFEMSKFLGLWYMQETYSKHEPHAKCAKTTFTRDENGTVHALRDEINRKTGMRIMMPGTLEANNSTGSGKLNLYLYAMENSITDYWILETDYVSYAVMYFCLNVKGQRRLITSIILTRDKNPSKTVVATYLEVTEKFNLKRNYFFKIEQNDCSLRPSR